MLPVRELRLVPDQAADLDYVGHVVRALALADIPENWDQVVREHADDFAFLSISLSTRPGDDGPTVAIEFGVHDGAERRAVGGLVGGWQRADGVIRGLQVVMLRGASCSVTEFADELDFYVSLPESLTDTALID